jgi:ABC-type transport system involved in multi-copper enzyme maturation permease subunit
MSQTFALLLDAYRDLNSRRMFWIVLILSGLVAGSFAAIGLTPTGFEIFTWKFTSYFFNSKVVSPGDFYKSIFLNWGIDLWLSSIAAALALISTASLFPDFIAAGAIDLYLSKPISRVRLFLTKYFCGLLFVALQIACFCAASFLVIGIRGGAWEPGIFLAVPIVVLFFSYLFCVCVLIGVWTRSTVAAVLLTLLFWVGVFCLHSTEITLLTFQLTDHEAAHRIDMQIADTEKSIGKLQNASVTRPTTRNSVRLTTLQTQLADERTKRSEYHNAFDRPHEIFYDAMTVLPKTAETVALLQRKLISGARLQRVADQQDDSSNQNRVDLNGNPVPVAALQAELSHRTIGWIIGTSVAFEGVVLVLGAWIFCRRDY